MNAHRAQEQAVLIVSDVATEAALVQSLLEEHFDKVLVAADIDTTAEAFHKSHASVLVLVYKELEKATRFYLGLYRRASELKITLQSHQTIALCDRKDVKAAYDLCINGQINDYVQFWPTTHDSPRLLFSVRRALQDCSDHLNSSQSSAALIAQGQRLSQLEELLSGYMNAGAGHMATAGGALTRAEADIESALESLSEKILNGTSVQLRPGCAATDLTREISRFNAEAILPQLRGVGRTLEPLAEWADKLEKAVAPHIKTSRAQLEQALPSGPAILIVDDDHFQRQMAGRIVESAGYRPFYAANGNEALNFLRKTPADLVLMDVLMPDMSGLQALQQLKSDRALAKIPVIMVTGKAGREVVLESVKLGVADFVVKPMERTLLLGKISRLLAPAATNAA